MSDLGQSLGQAYGTYLSTCPNDYLGNSIETKKSEATMRGKYQNQDTNDPWKIPAEYLDENGNWRMLDRRERAMLTDGQLYAYFNERY